MQGYTIINSADRARIAWAGGGGGQRERSRGGNDLDMVEEEGSLPFCRNRVCPE